MRRFSVPSSLFAPRCLFALDGQLGPDEYLNEELSKEEAKKSFPLTIAPFHNSTLKYRRCDIGSEFSIKLEKSCICAYPLQ